MSLPPISAALLATTLLLSGCLPGSNPVRSDPAEPQFPVFRYEQITRNEGLRGDFAFELHDRVATLPDRQRIDSSFKFTGYILGKLIDDRQTVTITRLDRDLIWTANPKKKRYTEMPIGKLGDLRFQMPREDPKGEKVYVEECCKTTTSVRRTGTRKIINGFDSEQVLLTVTSQCNEQIGEPNTTVIKMEVWVSAGAKFGPEVDAFQQAYLRKAGFDVDAARAMGDQMLALFPQAKDLFKLLDGIKGVPVHWVVTVEDEQYLKKKAAARAGAAETKDTPRSVSDAVFSFGSKLFKERQDAKEKENDLKWGNVIFRVTWELRNFERGNAGQSAFELAADWTRVENEQQIEGSEATQTKVEHKPARYVPTQCLATLDQAKLGVPLPAGSLVARTKPYDHGDHNTKYYYASRTDYRVLFGSPEPPAKLVAFYEKALGVKCPPATVDGGKSFVCRKGTQTVRIDEKPLELAADLSMADAMSGTVETRTLTGFELRNGK
jgi:hypothetical protein